MLRDCGVNGITTLSCIFPLIDNIIFWALTLSGSFAVILIIIAGIKLITSGGDPKKVDSGKRTLTFAVIGLIVIFLSFAIISFIGYTTGVACISFTTSGPLPSFTSCH